MKNNSSIENIMSVVDIMRIDALDIKKIYNINGVIISYSANEWSWITTDNGFIIDSDLSLILLINRLIKELEDSEKNEIEHECLFLPNQSDSYIFISEYYGDQKTNRSDIHFMNHIDEGLYILNKLNVSTNVKDAYCLHPVLQNDNDLLKCVDLLEHIDTRVIINAMEYRSVANEYLSNRTITELSEIRLSPLKDVNDMLIADKIQNYKDFELYHKDTHPRSKELTQYFENWLLRLNISKEFYNECVSELTKKIDYV